MTTRLNARDWLLTLCGCLLILFTTLARTQSDASQRSFPQSKAAIEKALAAIKNNMAGHLPVLEGFAQPAEHPLDRYRRGYYHATVEVVSEQPGGCVVRIRTKLTAWYSDSSSHSGYQLLASNGRIESDLLDQLAEQLSAPEDVEKIDTGPATRQFSPHPSNDERPSAPEPVRKFPEATGTVSPSLKDWAAPSAAEKSAAPSSKPDKSLKAQAENLEEILKNTSHPRNLVAVKKSGTPVVATPSLTAKPLFLASMHDEFEMLDFNSDWVHVRISGLSRGWVWRNSVEMPEGIPDTAASSSAASNTSADLFRVVREETALFPGNWEPLRGKTVKIVSVQKIDEGAQNVGLAERLEYTKYLMQKDYAEIADKKLQLQGIVLIFDSADGGMIAATAPALQQWRAGMLTDSALWHKCFFDPPESFDAGGSSGGR
jgi:hypothetical protein